jgi:hypothetical protein
MNIRTVISWAVRTCTLADMYQTLFYLEDGISRFLQNIGTYHITWHHIPEDHYFKEIKLFFLKMCFTVK